MAPLYVFSEYVLWHCTRGIRDYCAFFGTILWFEYHFFSIPLLLRTLITPWKLRREEGSGEFDPGDFFEVLLVNLVLRLVGFIVRAVVILVGFLAMVVTLLCGLVLFPIWFLLPVFAVLLLLSGIAHLVP